MKASKPESAQTTRPADVQDIAPRKLNFHDLMTRQWVASRERFELCRRDMQRARVSAYEIGLPADVIRTLDSYIDQLAECDHEIHANILECDARARTYATAKTKPRIYETKHDE